MLSQRSRSLKVRIFYKSIYNEMSKIGKSIKIDSRLLVARDWK